MLSQKQLIFLIFSFVLIVIACTPKVAEVVEEPKKEVVKEVVEAPKAPENPCATLQSLSPRERDEAETAYVLYKDQVKLKNYDEAFKLWQKAYYTAPAANGSIKYQFEDGIAIYKHFYENANSIEQKQIYLDSIISIYDKRVECYGEPAYVAGRKAFDYYYYYNEVADPNEIFELFKEAVDGKGEKVDYFVINPFTKIISDKVVAEEISLEEGRQYAMKLLDAIEYGTNSGKNKEAWSIINDYAPSRLENLEGLKGFYDCDYYTKKYYAEYLADSTNCEVINTSYGRMLWGGCNKENEIVKILAEAKERNCYTPPPPPGPLKMAFNAYTEGQYNEAVKLFDDFVQTTEDSEKKFKYNLLIAKIYYGDIKNYPKSRQYALKAAENKPESGEPYLLIGKLYASSGPLCGPGRGWDSQIVTWPAIDMFEKAKSDPTVRAEAQRFINTYWQYMPKKEDIFQRTIKAGSSFKVGCWINRTTTVRTAD